MGNLWIEQAIWPTAESAVHIALLPKPTGGERPIGLFRSIVRVVCKAAAWDGLKRFDEQDTPQLNTSKGRRIGDDIWRAQMRSQIGKQRHAWETMIDLLRASEYVSRRGFARRGGAVTLPNPRGGSQSSHVRFPQEAGL